MINENAGPSLHKDSTFFISFFLKLDMAQKNAKPFYIVPTTVKIVFSCK